VKAKSVSAKPPGVAKVPGLVTLSGARTAVATNIDPKQAAKAPLSLAIGIFDGVHLGHRAVLESLLAAAKQRQGYAALLTFWPHPSRVLYPEKATRLLMPPAEKTLHLHQSGLDLVIWQQFTPAFAQIAAEGFIPHLQAGLPTLASLHVGANFRFGADRSGDVELLTAQGNAAGLTVFSAPRLEADGEAVSSSRIRALLEAGKLRTANELLGYRYFTRATVQAGKQLGRTIGFPTLNLPWDPELRPKFGVYAVQVLGKGGAVYPAVANYGLRPTVEDATVPLLEVHCLEEPDLDAGDTVRVEWAEFIRPELKFPSLEALQSQITKDTEAARTFWETSTSF